MLDDYKNLYAISADQIPGWKSADKNELCRKCIENKANPLLYDAYLSAIICRYWGLIGKFYAQSTNLAEPMDCYDWLIHAILYALKHHQWDNPKSHVYNDPKGPDKVINRCMKSTRLIYYQFHNRKKRKKDYQIISIDELQETLNTDCIDIEDESARINVQEIDIEYFIAEIFNKKEYFLAFIIDCICNENVFESETNPIIFNVKKLVKIFKSIDDKYIRIFAQKYNLNYEDVYQAAILAKNIPEAKIKYRIEDTLLRLKHSQLMEIISGGK